MSAKKKVFFSGAENPENRQDDSPKKTYFFVECLPKNGEGSEVFKHVGVLFSRLTVAENKFTVKKRPLIKGIKFLYFNAFSG